VTAFVCPQCRGGLEQEDGGYRCNSCARAFPILFGVPDFRLGGDQYLTLDEERAKAARLHAYAQYHDFRELVAFYYSITDDVPEQLAPIFADYAVNAPSRAARAIEALAQAGPASAFLDLGCGSGGALVAARGMFQDRTGVDIALRWLVIARKRIEEAGVGAQFVCADAEALPFPESSFSHVLAADLVENTRSPTGAIQGAASVMADGGHLFLTSSNRQWIGPHPATGVWAAGLLPASFRTALLRRRHGVDLLRAVSFVSPGSVRRTAAAAGLRQLDARPLDIAPSALDHRSALFKALGRAYAILARAPLFRSVLLVAGPVFQSLYVKEKTS
jgi:SAM-dependent methyltransferase